MAQNGEISEKEKIRIVSDFLLRSPPGEFNEVFNDVRLLLNNDAQLREGCSGVFAQYNKDQFIPVRLENAEKSTLITNVNDLGGGRFLDPRSGKTFRYDHLRKEASDVQPGEAAESRVEGWRAALQSAADRYLENHFHVPDPKTGEPSVVGTAAVFGKMQQESGLPALTLCIESHKFSPKNFSNARWRSQWSIVMTEKTAELKGLIRVQVHYYEDGNVQLVSSKEITRKITVTNESSTAKEIINAVEQEESAYQTAVRENYENMNSVTFKALRRPLPVTRTKVDWQKIVGYRIGSELRM